MAAALPYIYLAVAAVGTGAAIHQGQVQSNYNKYLGDQAQADANAQQQAALVEAKRIRQQAQAQKGRAVAALAASGVNVDAGTALQINQTIDKNANEDAFMAITNGNNQAARLDAQAQGYDLQAGRDLTAGYVSGASSLLSGAASATKAGWKTNGV